MKNKYVDLNNHLFLQLERLNDEDLAGDKLGEEIQRAKALTGIASQIVANGNMMLNAIRIQSEYSRSNPPALPEFFQSSSEKPIPKKVIPDNVKAEYRRE